MSESPTPKSAESSATCSPSIPKRVSIKDSDPTYPAKALTTSEELEFNWWLALLEAYDRKRWYFIYNHPQFPGKRMEFFVPVEEFLICPKTK